MKNVMTWIVAAAIALPALSLAHEAHDKKKAVAVKKEQTEWGIAGEAKDVRRTVKLAMSDDMRFKPDRIEVKQGETLRISLRNNGKVLHEMVIGTKKVLDEHAALMMKFPDMEHDEPYIAHIPPGKTGEIIWTFNKTGEFDFACLIPGHFQSGMKGTIKVSSK